MVEMRGWMPVMMASTLACAGRPTGDGDAEAESSGGAETTSTSGISTSTTGSVDSEGSTTEADSSTSSASESTAFDDGCPPASDEIALVSDIQLDEAWVWPERDGIATATCDATAYEGGELTLSCLQDKGSVYPVDVLVPGGGPPIDEALASFAGMQELRLAIAYGSGFFPGIVPYEFTVRSSEGELLVLRSATYAGPGERVGDATRDWALPFTDLRTVDQGCAFSPSEPDNYPPPEQPFALELATDDGRVTVFHRAQETVTVETVAYEVSVDTTLVYDISMCPSECVSHRTAFSIVRHASE